jgi:2-oxoglutarate ferredoxin oxidoreductase subunit alpha
MADKPIVGERKAFMTGNEVAAWAALAAGADVMYGYPITPQTEIMQYWARMAPKYNKVFLQTEDEISAGFATVGGVLAGKRTFTATAGPGNTLMQEAMSMAEMMRIPTVMIVCQRGGPSTATVIYSQQEVTMTCFGGNGEGFRVVYSPSGHQDVYDYTIKAFNTAWKYRFPTFVLSDGYQAKMRESLTIYDPEVRGIEMVPTEAFVGKPGTPGVDREPSLLRNTYNMEEELYEVLVDIQKDYERMVPEVVEYKELHTEDAEIVILAHGVVSRAAEGAVKALREEGIKAGLFRPITLRPFPGQQLRELAGKVKKFLVVESAFGQLDKLVKQEIYRATTPMLNYFRPGEGITVEEVIEQVHQLV